MKFKNLLVIVAMISVLFLSIGTSHAVPGVADYVPGTDSVVIFMCEDTAADLDPVVPSGTMNTLWAIAETTGISAAASTFIFNTKSEFVLDDRAAWTPLDVVVDDCQSMIAGLSEANRAALRHTVTMNGVAKTVFAGYVVYFNDVLADQFISWQYMVDMPNGFSAGFNGFSAEGGVDFTSAFPFTASDLAENLGLDPVNASELYPRWFLLNTNANTFNWWIILKGGPSVTSGHVLSGIICDEAENCKSIAINIPLNLNIIDVKPIIPAALKASYPAGGFGLFDVIVPSNRSILGWSYQRAATNAISTNWDVIHPMHRWGPISE